MFAPSSLWWNNHHFPYGEPSLAIRKKEKMYLHRLNQLGDLSWSTYLHNNEHLLRLLEFGEESTSDSCPLSFFRSQQEEVLKSWSIWRRWSSPIHEFSTHHIQLNGVGATVSIVSPTSWILSCRKEVFSISRDGNVGYRELFLQFHASIHPFYHTYSFVYVALLSIQSTQLDVLKQVRSNKNITIDVSIIIAVEESWGFHKHVTDNRHLVWIQTTSSHLKTDTRIQSQQ